MNKTLQPFTFSPSLKQALDDLENHPDLTEDQKANILRMFEETVPEGLPPRRQDKE